MSISKPHYLDPKWKYYGPEETAQPGYLKRKFDKIRRELAEQKAKQEAETAKVTKIGKAAK